jgi:hypothetical protein
LGPQDARGGLSSPASLLLRARIHPAEAGKNSGHPEECPLFQTDPNHANNDSLYSHSLPDIIF